MSKPSKLEDSLEEAKDVLNKEQLASDLADIDLKKCQARLEAALSHAADLQQQLETHRAADAESSNGSTDPGDASHKDDQGDDNQWRSKTTTIKGSKTNKTTTIKGSKMTTVGKIVWLAEERHCRRQNWM